MSYAEAAIKERILALNFCTDERDAAEAEWLSYLLRLVEVDAI